MTPPENDWWITFDRAFTALAKRPAGPADYDAARLLKLIAETSTDTSSPYCVVAEIFL